MYEQADQALVDEFQERLSSLEFPRALRPGVLQFIEYMSDSGEPEVEIRQKVENFIQSRDMGDLWTDDPSAKGVIVGTSNDGFLGVWILFMLVVSIVMWLVTGN